MSLCMISDVLLRICRTTRTCDEISSHGLGILSTGRQEKGKRKGKGKGKGKGNFHTIMLISYKSACIH